MGRRRALFLNAPPARAMAEGTAPLLGALLLAALLRLAAPDARALLTLAALYGAVWCALRLRLATAPWPRQAVATGLIGGALALLLSLLAATGDALLLPTHPPSDRPGVILADVVAGAALVAAVRGVGRLWWSWQRLRRVRLRWAITHAHLVVATGVGLLVAALLVGVSVPYWSRSSGSIIVLLVAVTFALLAALALVVALVLPSSALFSWLVARGTTRRIEALTAATARLRAGHYDLRVPVEGEDEVARLQGDFNAMAADLERTVGALREERDRVAALLAARRELVASVSHELRTPVATLRGYLESVDRGWEDIPPPTLRQDLRVMGRETGRLQALIDDLFALARLDMDRLEMRRAPTDVGAAARRCVEAVAPLAWRASRVKVVCETTPAPPALVDGGRLEQIVRNLLHNAVRHTSPGGIVAVTVERDAMVVVLRVVDTGEGIAPEDLPRIWDRFYQADGTRTRTAGGTGLGLALVKELAEAMGGTITAESVLHEGSAFTLRLPCYGYGGMPTSA